MSKDRHDDELYELLQGRIPEPAPDYWETINERLSDGGQGHEPGEDTDGSMASPMHLGKPKDPATPTSDAHSAWLRNRNLLAAAALVFIVGVAVFALANQSSTDSIDIATASDQTGTADGSTNDSTTDETAASNENDEFDQSSGTTNESFDAPEGPASAPFDTPASPDESAAWPLDDAVLSSVGLGPIRIGMTVSQLSSELGTELAIDTLNGNVVGACGWITTSAIDGDVWVIVELTSPADAVIRRVTVSNSRWSTPSGMTVGVSEQTVLETFPGQIESSPHVYVDGNYLTFQPNNTNDPNTVQFVSEGGFVAQIHAGDRNWVGLVEGCA